MDKRQQNKAYLQIFIAGCFWGLIGLFVATMQNMGADNGLIGLLRMVSALIFMFCTIIITCKSFKPFIISKQVLIITAIMGIFAQGIQNLCYAIAVNIVGVATSAILVYTAPVFVCIMSAIFFKESITSIKILALILNISGCTLVVTNGNFSILSFALIGVIMGVLSGFLYALVTICGKLATNSTHPLVTIFYAFFFAAIFLAFYTKPWNYTSESLTLPILSIGIVYGIFCSGIPYIFYMNALSKPINVSIVPVLASSEVIVAAATGVLFFSESMGIWKVLGIGLVFASIVVMSMASKTIKQKSLYSDSDEINV
jgi:drug/metabolite transporter (DMT)-like permease